MRSGLSPSVCGCGGLGAASQWIAVPWLPPGVGDAMGCHPSPPQRLVQPSAAAWRVAALFAAVGSAARGPVPFGGSWRAGPSTRVPALAAKSRFLTPSSGCPSLVCWRWGWCASPFFCWGWCWFRAGVARSGLAALSGSKSHHLLVALVPRCWVCGFYFCFPWDLAFAPSPLFLLLFFAPVGCCFFWPVAAGF